LILLELSFDYTPDIYALIGHGLSLFTKPQNWQVATLLFQDARPPAIDGDRI
jgi:hypothetical protein